MNLRSNTRQVSLALQSITVETNLIKEPSEESPRSPKLDPIVYSSSSDEESNRARKKKSPAPKEKNPLKNDFQRFERKKKKRELPAVYSDKPVHLKLRLRKSKQNEKRTE